MPIEVKTYKEYLADEDESSRENVGDHFFDYVRKKLMQCGVRFKINKEAESGNSERAD